MTLLLLLRFVVLHLDFASAGETRAQQNQGSVCVNGESFRVLLEVLALGVRSSNADRNLHQHALTAPPRSRIRRCVRCLSHTTSLQQLYAAGDHCRESLGQQDSNSIPGFFSCAGRWVRNGACRVPDKSAAAVRFSARGRAASLPIARSIPRCGELRTARGT
jgi:hypothetical protein